MQIRELLADNFVSYEVKVCPRLCDQVPDYLANHGCRALPAGESVFWCSTPSVVANLVAGDLP